MRTSTIIAAALAAPLSTAASAADLAPVAAIAPAASAAPSWTGWYAGLHAGYARSHVSVTDNAADGVDPGPFSYGQNGAIGGGQFGYNYQFGHFVVGGEADVGYMGLSGSGRIGSANAAAHQDLTLDGGMYGDVKARLGYAFGRNLVYATGGWAYFHTNAQQATTNPGYAPTGTGSLNGWTFGGGYEYRLSDALSLKVEYQHFDFGTHGGYQTNVGDPTSPPGYQFLNEHRVTVDAVMAGLNYHF